MQPALSQQLAGRPQADMGRPLGQCCRLPLVALDQGGRLERLASRNPPLLFRLPDTPERNLTDGLEVPIHHTAAPEVGGLFR